MRRIAGDRRRIGGFFDKIGDHIVGVHRHDAKIAGILAGDDEATDGDIRARVDMLLQHQLIVHLVDVIASQNHHVLRSVGFDDVDILVNRVRRAFVPQKL